MWSHSFKQCDQLLYCGSLCLALATPSDYLQRLLAGLRWYCLLKDGQEVFKPVILLKPGELQTMQSSTELIKLLLVWEAIFRLLAFVMIREALTHFLRMHRERHKIPGRCACVCRSEILHVGPNNSR